MQSAIMIKRIRRRCIEDIPRRGSVRISASARSPSTRCSIGGIACNRCVGFAIVEGRGDGIGEISYRRMVAG